MRILFVTDFYHPYVGGVEIHVRTMAMALADRGHDVAVATLPTAGGEPERTEDGPVTVFTVRHLAQQAGARFVNADRRWAPPFADPLAAKDLRGVVRDFNPDVIHGHDWLARSVQPKVVSGDVPLVTTLHYYTRTCAKKTLWRNGAVCEGPSLKRCVSCASDHYGTARGVAVALGVRAGTVVENRRTAGWISVSAATEEGNGLTGQPSSSVIFNPVPSLIGSSSSGQAAGREPDVKDLLPTALADQPFIMFVGDIRPEKGVAVLAEAVEIMRTSGDETPLVIVGQRMRSAITLPPETYELGLVPNNSVKALWTRATIGVVPSLWPEPFGLVAIEAMEGGCPLVASDVGGLSEILADGRGTLVSPGDPVALAAAIGELLGDHERRKRQAASALASMDRFSLDTIVDQVEQVYRDAITSSAHG